MKTKNLLLTLTVTLMLLAPFSLNFATAEPDANLVIITPHWEGIMNEFTAAFEEFYQDKHGEAVNIEVIDVGGTSDVVKYIDSTFQATPNSIGIDVFWGGGVDPFLAQADKGQLLTYQLPEDILSKIPETFAGIPVYDSEYRWYGSALSGFGIIYNKAILEIEGLPTPTTWADLADPSIIGWVGSADPRHSGSTHMMYEIILQGLGWEQGLKLATEMGANIKTFPPSSSQVPRSVGAGDIAYGLAIDFYAWSQVASVGEDKIGYVMPEGLTVINPDSIAILKGAPNLDVAKEFVNFVLSDEGQKLWMLPVGAEGGPKEYLLGRMSVIPDLYSELGDQAVVPINPFEVETTLDYNATLGSIRWSLVNDIIGATVIDSHPELISTWREIITMEKTLDEAGIDSGFINQAKDKMGESPITEADAIQLTQEWGDAETRNTYISEWHDFSIEKYESASNLVSLAGADLVEQFEEAMQELNAEKQNNLYMGLGGGIVVGAIVGYFVAYSMSRRREIEAVTE
jgi:ABC-type Fe3+ transport system substrate-binding protein